MTRIAELILYEIQRDTVGYAILCNIVIMLCMLSSYHCDNICGNVVYVYQCIICLCVFRTQISFNEFLMTE